MTIKQLKELIDNLNDDLIILTPTSDHSLRLAYFDTGTAMVSDGVYQNGYSDDFGERQTKNRKRIDCLIVE